MATSAAIEEELELRLAATERTVALLAVKLDRLAPIAGDAIPSGGGDLAPDLGDSVTDSRTAAPPLLPSASASPSGWAVQPRARVTTNFLPKFENARGDLEEYRLSRTHAPGRTSSKSPNVPAQTGGSSIAAAGSAEPVKVLVVSKKHSGSLVMAPPFFAKNSTANKFSRMAAVLLQDHFRACWGEAADAKFAGWWEHAVRCGITYSFECVTPRLLGDHGATPRAAYLVLTAVSSDSDFLSPTSVLQLATAWRLPLNEAWYVPWSEAAPVEDRLHTTRWDANDPMVDAMMSEVPSAVLQRFLTHTDTQGEILEGFVLMTLEISADDADAVARLASEYSRVMTPFRADALARALALGHRCLDDGGAVLEMLSRPIEGCPEPTPALAPVLDGADRTVSGVIDHAVKKAAETYWWDFACADYGAPALQRLFQVLRNHYSHVTKLKPYRLNGRTLLQVQINSDDVFYSWRMHMLRGAAPLFRGMVVTFSDSPLPALDSVNRDRGDGQGFEATVGSRIVEIAKLKCLKYIIRTFAIRNKLDKLLRDGAELYVRSVHRTFCRNWSIPESHQVAVKALMSKWALHVTRLPPIPRQALEAGQYLAVLEPFLAGFEHGLEAGDGNSGGKDSTSVFEQYAVIVCDLSYAGLPPSIWAPFVDRFVPAAGKGPSAPVAGTYTVLRAPPAVKHINGGAPVIVVAFPPDSCATTGHAAPTCTMPTPADERKYGKMWDHFVSDNWRQRFPNAVVIQGPTAVSWAGLVAGLRMPEPPVITVKYVVAVMALPPGGGKSTFFQALQRRHGAIIISSDEARARKRDFNGMLLKALRSKDQLVIGYDKNIPNIDGLKHLCRIVSPLQKDDRIEVRFILVAPISVNADVCWARVADRPAEHIGLHIHGKGEAEAAQDIFSRIFLSESTRFAEVLNAPEWGYVQRTDVFWGPQDGIDAAVDAAVADRGAAAVELGTIMADADLVPAMARVTGNWISMELEGTNLHVTLVPPNNESRDAFKAFRHLAGQSGFSVELGDYRLATTTDPSNDKDLSVGFWTVEDIHGLALEDREASQARVYHVTDVASIYPTFGAATKPKHAADAMRTLRKLPASDRSTLKWKIQRFPYPTLGSGGGGSGGDVTSTVRLPGKIVAV